MSCWVRDLQYSSFNQNGVEGVHRDTKAKEVRKTASEGIQGPENNMGASPSSCRAE